MTLATKTRHESGRPWPPPPPQGTSVVETGCSGKRARRHLDVRAEGVVATDVKKGVLAPNADTVSRPQHPRRHLRTDPNQCLVLGLGGFKWSNTLLSDPSTPCTVLPVSLLAPVLPLTPVAHFVEMAPHPFGEEHRRLLPVPSVLRRDPLLSVCSFPVGSVGSRRAQGLPPLPRKYLKPRNVPPS